MNDNFKSAIPAIVIILALYACAGTMDYREQVKQHEIVKVKK